MTKNTGLDFVRLDIDSLYLVAFTDAAFANAPGCRSQLGFVVAAMNTSGAANIVHYGSSRCRRVARSVVRAELLALMEGFDVAFTVKHAMREIHQRDVPLDIFTDSRTVFNIVAKDASSLEKRLQIGAFALRESHCREEIRHFGWIPGIENPADGLTRLRLLSDLHPSECSWRRILWL